MTFACTIKSVKRKQLPALDDEFAKDCGPYQSLQEIREKLQAEMERALKKDIEDSYKDTILKAIGRNASFRSSQERSSSANCPPWLDSNYSLANESLETALLHLMPRNLTTPNSSRRNIVPRQSGE